MAKDRVRFTRRDRALLVPLKARFSHPFTGSMMIAAHYGVAGMTAATRRFETAASNIARASVPEANVDLPAAMVELSQSKNAFSANAAVVRTSDEMSKELLNIIA